MASKTTRFDASKYLESTEDQADLLNDALATGHAGYIAAALGAIARARGMSELARETGLTRQSLYKALSEDGNPTLDTVLKVANHFGLKLSVQRADKRELADA